MRERRGEGGKTHYLRIANNFMEATPEHPNAAPKLSSSSSVCIDLIYFYQEMQLYFVMICTLQWKKEEQRKEFSICLMQQGKIK